MKQYIYQLMTDARQGLLDQVVKALLWLLSLIYGFIVFCTRQLYKTGILPAYHPPKVVVSVGNITVGGTGKTPLVIWITRMLKERGIKVAVLSRGYGAHEGLNDEVCMFKEILPEVKLGVGRDRKESIQEILKQDLTDIFVADDGFQHWPLYRDLDIVAIDAANPFGNGRLLPRGILREPLSALGRAHIFVLTKTDRVQSTQSLREELKRLNPKALIVESQHIIKNLRNINTGQIQDLNSFKGKKIMIFCAIADPTAFIYTLEKFGFVIAKKFIFADHYQYNEDDTRKIAQSARAENMNILVTTHKDAVKISALHDQLTGLTVLSLDIDLKITQGQDEFIKRIISLPHC